MILSRDGILQGIMSGDIQIDPFDESNLNPNSYNLSLNNKLKIYDSYVIDSKQKNETLDVYIPKEGFLLKPGVLYLGRTNEYTSTYKYVPVLEGRSSIGRLGVSIHVTAGFGDIGFCGYWTLEIHCIQPVMIYPDMRFCQIVYHSIDNSNGNYYAGKYQNQKDIEGCKLYEELCDK